MNRRLFPAHGPARDEKKTEILPLVLLDRELDRRARARLRERHPDCFDGEELSPNHKYNAHRKLKRDWSRAATRILLGLGYRSVAREFSCSVGVLHKQVQAWRMN